MTTESLESAVRWLVDRAQISELLFAFAAALDTKDWHLYTDLYADGGFIELPDPKSTEGKTFILRKAQMLELVPLSLGRYVATHHLSTNHQIQVLENTAQVRSYLQAVHVAGAPTDHWTAGGWYDSHVVRTPAGWRFERVKLTAVWLAGQVGEIVPR